MNFEVSLDYGGFAAYSNAYYVNLGSTDQEEKAAIAGALFHYGTQEKCGIYVESTGAYLVHMAGT
jgi:hypothetical protein